MSEEENGRKERGEEGEFLKTEFIESGWNKSCASPGSVANGT